MNTIRTIESATLISIGVFCAAAVTSVILQSAHALPQSGANAFDNPATVQLAPVVVSAKRLTTAQKAVTFKNGAMG
jgi:hypothetical protein